MRYKRSIDFRPSITLTSMQTWNATVSYPGSSKAATHYYGYEIVKLREFIFANHPEFIEE